jgi:hypothetical protein
MKIPNCYVEYGEFAEFKPILKAWCRVNRIYMKKSEKDCPWRYNERALISLLAAAAWTLGYPAMEEFATFKGRRKDETHGPGRCDLKIQIDGKTYLFEIKKHRPHLGKKAGEDDIREVVDKIMLGCLQKACRDAGKLKSKAGRRFGLCFVAPVISEAEESKLEEKLDILIAQLKKKEPKYHLFSWFFAADRDRVRFNGKIYPGVFLLARETKKYQSPKRKHH